MSDQIDPKFEKLIDGIVKVEKAKAEAAQAQSDPKPWMNFASDDIPAEQRPSEKKESELEEKTFNRETANKDYIKARGEDDAKSKEIAIAKIAGDFFGACVRDKRQQWRSRIRQLAHGFAVAAGNGENAGPLRRNTIDYLQRMFLKSTEEKKSAS